MNDAHEDLEVQCYEQNDGEPCNTTVTYVDHYVGLRRKREFEGKALGLKCPECGKLHKVCGVCHGGGWYRGEQTNKNLACHVCNTREHQRQMRSAY